MNPTGALALVFLGTLAAFLTGEPVALFVVTGVGYVVNDAFTRPKIA